MIVDIQGISFEWPMAFWAFLVFPFIIIWYLRSERQKWKQAFRFSYTSAVENISRNSSLLKRIAPLFFLLLFLSLGIVTAAKPVLEVKKENKAMNMMLVLDVSISMMGDDLSPSRIDVAREAAIKFVEQLPKDVHVGLEVFARKPFVLAEPSSNHQSVISKLREIDQEDLRQHTGIGNAIRAATRVLEVPEDARVVNEDGSKGLPRRVIVLLGDGDSTTGADWEAATEEARRQNIIVHTVAIGTENRVNLDFGFSKKYEVSFSERTLKRIASIGGGTFYRVFQEKDFEDVYSRIRGYLVTLNTEKLELLHPLVLTLLGFMMVSAFLSGGRRAL